MTRYTRNAKEVLRDGKHFADCIDDSAARLIADALNERKGMPQTQQSLPLDGADGPLFVEPSALVVLTSEMIEREKLAIQNIGDLPVLRSYLGKPVSAHHVRQENDEYACMCGMRWDITEGEDHP